jgi:hypothetical protein
MRIPLLGGAYQSRSLVAGAQRSVNLYPEFNEPSGTPPVPVTHYPTPGLRIVSQAPIVGRYRAVYRATNGDLYVVVNSSVYFVSADYVWTLLGTITFGSNSLGIADNGLCIVIVDGSSTGWTIDMATRTFGVITDPSFYGATSVDYLDTYFIFNRPNTAQFYISLSLVTFDMLTGTPGAIYQGALVKGGGGYTNGTYTNVPLAGGTGTGATANLTVAGGIVTVATINAPGTGYSVNDTLTLTSTTPGTPGAVKAGAIGSAGSAYTNGTYANVPLTGGTGTGAQATVIVSGAVVTSVTITAAGSGYVVNDTLSATAASIGGTGSGFTWNVSLVTGGFVYTVDFVHGYAFDPLDIAGKTGAADNIQCLAAIHGELWLIGELTSEIWANTGAADFTFGRIQGAFINHGCVAPYSLSQQDVSLFWLTQDRQGNAIVAMSAGYAVERVSTHAIEQEFQSYSKIDDAIGYCHQIEGHAFYILNFPTANKTWAYELSTKQWHERGSLDGNGVLNRHRGNAFAFAYGRGHVGDFQNGTLYVFDQDYYFDGTTAIPRIRTFPHLVGDDSNRVEYIRFVADLEVGQTDGTTPSNPPLISLRWSDTRGVTYGSPVIRSMGATGEYYVSPQWRKLGIARDRVFEISWSAPVRTALQGGWVEIRKSAS